MTLPVTVSQLLSAVRMVIVCWATERIFVTVSPLPNTPYLVVCLVQSWFLPARNWLLRPILSFFAGTVGAEAEG
jgi:hypothetical protein